MAKQNSFVGAHIGSENKERFQELAAQEGVTQSVLLSRAVSQYMDGGSVVYDEVDVFEEEEINFDEQFDKLGSRLQDQLNCILADGYDGVDDESEYYVQDALNNIANKLDDEAKNELEYQCAESFLSEDWLIESYGEEAKEIISQAIEELGDLSRDKTVLFPLIASFMRQRSEQLYSDDRKMYLQFNRSEWETLDRFIAIVNRDGDHKFSSVKSFVKFKLGELMDYAGTGMLFDRDKAMRITGKRFMKEVKEE